MTTDKNPNPLSSRLDDFLKSRGLADLARLPSVKSGSGDVRNADVLGELEYQGLKRSASDLVESSVFYFLRYKKIDFSIDRLSSEKKIKLLSALNKKARSIMFLISSKRALSFDKMFSGGFGPGAKRRASGGLPKGHPSKAEMLRLEEFLDRCHLISRGVHLKEDDLGGEIHFAEEMLFSMKQLGDEIKKLT